MNSLLWSVKRFIHEILVINKRRSVLFWVLLGFHNNAQTPNHDDHIRIKSKQVKFLRQQNELVQSIQFNFTEQHYFTLHFCWIIPKSLIPEVVPVITCVCPRIARHMRAI